MPDKAQVIYGIERCVCRVPNACIDCSKYGYGNERCMEDLLSDALALIREHDVRQIAFDKLIHTYDPFYVITKDAEIDCWAFFVAYVESKHTIIIRDQDGCLIDFNRDDYGKTWLCFDGRVGDQTWTSVKWDD